MKIETTMKYHFTLTVVQNNKCSQECGETETLILHCWWKCKIVEPLWKTLAVPQKVKVSYDPTVLELKTHGHTKTCTSIHSSIIYNNQKVEK